MKRKSLLAEITSYMWKEKTWWMIPPAVMLLLAGMLILFAQSTPVSPFIYALF